MKNLLLLVLLILSFPTDLAAQQSRSERAYRQYPHWIAMMDDTLANYNEVTRAFGLYWETRAMPSEEDAILGMKDAGEAEKQDKESWLRKLFPVKRQPDEAELAYAIKRYRHWQVKSAPWVQEDGTLLTPAQRRQILESIHR